MAAETRPKQLFSKNTGLCKAARRSIWADACPVLEGYEEGFDNTSGEIEVPVKMLATRARTERPHGALLQFVTGVRYIMHRIGGRRRGVDFGRHGVTVGIPPLVYWASNQRP